MYCIFRDRFYTVHNVWGASIGTGILAHYNRKKFENQEFFQSIEENENTGCLGGFKLFAKKGRIVCSQTIDDRIELCF